MMDALGTALYQLLDSSLVLKVGAWLCLPLSVAVIVMVARPRNRDERGWKIFGKAGVVAFVVFFVAVNLIAKSSGGVPMEISYVFYASTLQWLYNLVLAVWIVAVLVLRRVM